MFVWMFWSIVLAKYVLSNIFSRFMLHMTTNK